MKLPFGAGDAETGPNFSVAIPDGSGQTIGSRAVFLVAHRISLFPNPGVFLKHALRIGDGPGGTHLERSAREKNADLFGITVGREEFSQCAA